MALREEVREWVEEKLMPNVTEWDEAKKVPDEIYREMGERGYLAGLLGMHFPAHLTQTRVKSVPPEKWDHFHEMILTDELSRTGSGGLVWNLIGGYGIGAPPVFKFAKPELIKRIGPGLLSGEKRICLAITEPGKLAHSALAMEDKWANISQMPAVTSQGSRARPSSPRTASTTLSTARRNGSPTACGLTTSRRRCAPAQTA